MSDQKEEMSDLKNAGKNRGKKGSLKSVREKIVYMNPWGLWSDPCGPSGGAQRSMIFLTQRNKLTRTCLGCTPLLLPAPQ